MSTYAEHKRTVLRLTVGRHSLGAACHPGCTGAGAGSALTWPLPAATLGLWLDPFAAPYASLSAAAHPVSPAQLMWMPPARVMCHSVQPHHKYSH